jgi:DNA-binding transcriptional regulator YiaG
VRKDYHYTECGLDNVWLTNGFIAKKTPYGTAVSVEMADELHAAIAMDLVNKKARLTGKEFRFLRLQLCMSQSNVAKAHGVTEQAVSLWERTGKVPKANDILMRVCYQAKRNGNAAVASIIDRMNDVERLVHQRIVAKTTRAKGWTSRMEDASDSSFAIAA